MAKRSVNHASRLFRPMGMWSNCGKRSGDRVTACHPSRRSTGAADPDSGWHPIRPGRAGSLPDRRTTLEIRNETPQPAELGYSFLLCQWPLSTTLSRAESEPVMLVSRLWEQVFCLRRRWPAPRGLKLLMRFRP